MRPTKYAVIHAAPNAVRVGALRGRSRMWCSRLSPVTQDSMNGYMAMAPSTRPKATSGMNTPRTSVWPHRLISQPGMTRTRPSAKPMYQSGWAPVDTWSTR